MSKNRLQQSVDKANLMFGKDDCGHIAEIGYNDGEAYINVIGDWKHDHDFCDFVMSICGFEKISERVTKEDGSYWYESIHNYQLKS